MGSPPMNIIESKVVEDQGKIWLDMGFFKFELPQDITDSLKSGATAGSVVQVGIHAEDVRISLDKLGGQEFQVEVYVVEPTGPNLVIDLKAGEIILKAISTLANLKIGDRVWVSFPAEKMHIYDAKTEQILI
jgi:multiple sugar transport system ATP-binding protein